MIFNVSPFRLTGGVFLRKQTLLHVQAVLQALLVTFLWSTSWVLIKIGLHHIPSLIFAGLRYALAVLCLLPLVVQPMHLRAVRKLSKSKWQQLILLGVLLYAITQGGQFLSLSALPAISVSLLLNCTPLLVALLGGIILAERPTWLQWAGIGCYLLGIMAYFWPISFSAGQAPGFIAVAVTVLGNAGSALLGRSINKAHDLHPLVITVVSMGIGALLLLVVGVYFQGLPHLSLLDVALILWLAGVNTAFAFTLWNHTLRTLSATESSVLNNSMLIFIAVLAWVFLGEHPSWQACVGLGLAATGVLTVQIFKRV
ncbi:MAG TPA: DMT family transporter [Ktedonosporobacter sp.]|nr:DMT family transporter [Ktedonosporobacter sp.]